MAIDTVKLKKHFDKGNFNQGAPAFKYACWYIVNLIFFKSGLVPFSNILVFVLRRFGATIGKNVRIKPGIHIRYPWKLTVGDFCWLGECYIDNLDLVIIGKNVCISQKAILITGNHDYSSQSFNLITKPILLEDGVWICAGSMIAPGIVASSHSILSIGSVATQNMEEYTIYQGNPAIKIRKRCIF